jgi:hypothetical protein
VINKITMTIEIAGKDPVAYAVKVNAALMNLDAGAPPVVKVSEPAPVPTPDIPAQLPEQPAAVEASAKPKRGRPTKAAQEAKAAAAPVPAAPPAPAPVPAPVVPQATATQQEAQDALARLFEKAGLQTSLDLLTRHGVKRVSDLKPETRLAFIAAAEQWTAAGGDPQATIAGAV